MTSLSEKSINNSLTRSNKKEIVGWVIPDYTSGVSKSWDTEYTAETNGFIFALRQTSSSEIGTQGTLTIDGVSFEFQYFNSTSGSQRSAICMPIKKGSTYIATNKGNNANLMTFFPCIGG